MVGVIEEIVVGDEGRVLFNEVEIKGDGKVKEKMIYMGVENGFYEKYRYKEVVGIVRRMYGNFDVS